MRQCSCARIPVVTLAALYCRRVPGLYDSSLTRVQPFFKRAFALETNWLSALLAAAPRGRQALGDIVDAPGQVLPTLVGPHPKGKAAHACFEYEVLPARAFLRWCVQHPDKLTWPAGEQYGEETTRRRRALLYGDPPGREQTQREALRLIEELPPSTSAWWRFEGSSWIDCLIATDRLVITVEGKRKEGLSAATDWYPRRSQLVRNLEAAQQLSNGRRYATLLLSEEPVRGGDPNEVAGSLDDAAPHLCEEERADLQEAYLGNLTWDWACEAIGIPFSALPATTEEL